MTLVAPKPNGGLASETKRRITRALSVHLGDLALFLNLPLIEVDHYLSTIEGYKPSTLRVSERRYTPNHVLQGQITDRIQKVIPEISSAIGETIADIRLYFEWCFIRVVGEPVPTGVVIPASNVQKHKTMAARA